MIKGFFMRVLRCLQLPLRASCGFTLMETAVVMVILGFVFVPIFSMLVQDQLEANIVKDNQKNERAASAVNFYLRQNGAYPCPADPSLGPGDAAFGVADCTKPTVDDVMTGALPVVTLGMPFHAAINRHGWKYIYAVSDNLRLGSALGFDGEGVISVVDRGGSESKGLHYVIVDVGVDGKGAYNLEGNQGVIDPGCVSSAFDAENCDRDNTFSDGGEGGAGGPLSANYYDDALSYDYVSEKSDFWVIKDSGSPGIIELNNSAKGRVGFGTETPTARMQVAGTMILERDSTTGKGGVVDVEGDIVVGNSLIVEEIKPEVSVTSERFCVSGWAWRNGGSVQCCKQNLYKEWSESGYSEECGLACGNGKILGSNGECCSNRGELDAEGNCPD